MSCVISCIIAGHLEVRDTHDRVGTFVVRKLGVFFEAESCKVVVDLRHVVVKRDLRINIVSVKFVVETVCPVFVNETFVFFFVGQLCYCAAGELVVVIFKIIAQKEIYYKFHNRRIVSNYFVVKMDYSLAAFNKTEGTSEQTITPQVLFTEESLNNRSSAPLKSLQQITKALQSFSESLNSPQMDHNSYSYAVNGQRKDRCMTITNRLIK